jgi:hypothetical protein
MFGQEGWILVENDGELDLRLLELMGASTKDGESTIGCFGTGWKYGLALSLRNNINVMVFSGKRKITFSTRTEEIGTDKFERIMLSVGNGKPIRTSLTTGMGKKDWNDEWYFLREVLSNAFDAGGFSTRRVSSVESLSGDPGKTRVYLSLTPRFEEILADMKKFVRRSGELSASQHGKVFSASGDKCRIYKRGIFVRELDVPGIFDYDLFDVKLSESRTADSWDIGWEMRRVLTEMPIGVRRQALVALEEAHKGKKTVAECAMTFPSYGTDHQVPWAEAFKEEFGEEAVLCADSDLVRDSVSGVGKRPVSLPERVAEILRGEKGVTTEKQVVGAGIAAGYVYREAGEFEEQVLQKATSIVSVAFGDCLHRFPLRVFKSEEKHSTDKVRLLQEDDKTYSMLVNESVLAAGVRPLVEAMYLELLSFSACGGDAAKDLRASCLKTFIEKTLPKMKVVI